MKIIILIIASFLSITNIHAQIYSVGKGDGFSVKGYIHNTKFEIYSVGTGDGFSYSGISSMGIIVPLPIELLSFSAECSNQNIIISWITASEINNHFFTIERSADGVDFQNIGTIAGAGNSNQNLYYTFEDSETLEGISYYRLKQTDFDGKFEYSKVIAVENCKESSMELSIYPNPSNGIFFLTYTGDKEQVYSIKVYNIIGEIVYHSIDYQSNIILSDNKSGIYLVQLISPKGTIIKKIINN